MDQLTASQFVAPGTLLLSAPELQDPNFMHAVVLILDHDAIGAIGLIVNRKTDAVVSDVFPTHGFLSGVGLALREGGPVGLDTLQILEYLEPGSDSAESELATGIHLGEGIHVGGEVDDVVRRLAASKVPDQHLRFIVGYSGWGHGQLESEIASRAWLPLKATRDLVFSDGDPASVWRAAMGRLAGGGSSLAHLPPDPSWN